LYTARVAVETDWELMQRVNGNAAAAAAYIGDLLAYASTIYDSEVKTDVVIGHLSLWATSADPWGQTSSTCALLEFGRHWNDNEAGVGRTLALFLSGKGTGGGVAWVGVLCEGGFNVNLNGSCPALTPTIDNYGGAYAFVGSVSGTSFDLDNPTAAWDIVATNHEMGHNFDSPHTHCYEGLGGNPEPVDRCYSGQCVTPGCSCSSPVLPGCSSGGGCGTIMSYCHLLSGGFTNISLTLGAGHPFGVQPQRVPDRMRQHVESRAALLPSCLARQTPCDDLEVSDATISSAATYATCGTLTAGPELLVTPSGYLTLQARTVVLRDGFSVAAGGRLRVISPP